MGVKGARTGRGDPELFTGPNNSSDDFSLKDLLKVTSVFFRGDFFVGGFLGEEVLCGRGDFMTSDWLVAMELLKLVLDLF